MSFSLGTILPKNVVKSGRFRKKDIKEEKPYRGPGGASIEGTLTTRKRACPTLPPTLLLYQIFLRILFSKTKSRFPENLFPEVIFQNHINRKSF